MNYYIGLAIVVVILVLFAVIALWVLDSFFHSEWWERITGRGWFVVRRRR